MKKVMIILVGALLAILLLSIPAMAAEKPEVMITFDDGPSADESTQRILKTADKYGIQITVFMNGYRANLEPEMVRATHESGHAIGNHTWSHPYMTRLNLSAQTKQLQDTQDIISDLTGGYVPTCWRPPYGDTNEMTEARASALGLEQVMWTVDTNDFALRNRYKIVQQLNLYVRDGSNVLMHDGPNNRLETAAAFEMWLADNWDKFDFVIPPGCTEPEPPIPGPFDDVHGDHIFASEIEWLKDSGITNGCNADGTKFCPDRYVTRGEMAAFLDRAHDLPSVEADFFNDDNQSMFEESINALRQAGITRGCNADGTMFCPDRYITRSELAALLDRALGLPSAKKDFFNDDNQSMFEESINALRQAGITNGCNADGTKFCPDRYVTRGEMAAFLSRTQ